MPTKFNPNNRFEPGDPDESDDALWELLSVYADGEATPEEVEKVEALLRSDPSYSRQFEFLHLTSESARSYVEVEPPAALRDAIFAATIRKQTLATRMALAWDSLRHRFAPRYSVPLAGMAAAALLAAVYLPRLHPTSMPSHTADRIAENLTELPPVLETPSAIVLSHQTIGGEVNQPHVRSVMPSQGDGAGLHLVVATHPTVPEKKDQPRLVVATPHKDSPLHHDENDVQPAVYVVQPMMDAQNQRALAPPPPPQTSEVADEPDVKLPEFAKQSTPPPPPVDGGKTSGVVKVMYTTKLPSVGPDPKQILTRADLERRRTALTDGYDRSTIRSMERKETSFSLFKGSF